MVPAPHQKIIMGKDVATLPPLLASLLLPGAEYVSASQANSGSYQQQIERRQQSLLHIASGLKKSRVKDSIERQDAQQQRSEFGEFQ